MLFKTDSYSDYLYIHGLTVQLAEALAEMVHAKIRIECGFKEEEPKDKAAKKIEKKKLEVIKENYFPKAEDTPQPLTEEVEINESDELVEDIDASVSFYAERLKRHNNK